MLAKCISIFAVCLVLIGCEKSREIVRAERDNRGGYIDQATDRLLIADTYKMRVLRGYAVATAISGLALETGLGRAERQAAAAQLVSTMGLLRRAYDCAEKYPDCIYFDTRMFDVNKSLFGLVKAVLPIKEVQKVARVSSLGVSTIRALLDLGGRALKGTLRVAAIYRDTWDLYVNVYIDYLESHESGATAQQKTEIENAIEKLRKAHVSGAGNIREWKNIVRSFEGKHSEFIGFAKLVEPEPKHYNAVIDELTSNCKALAEAKIAELCAFKIIQITPATEAKPS